MRAVVCLLLTLTVTSAAHAATPNLVIAQQGRLLDDRDAPVEGNVDLTFVLSTRSTRPTATGEQDDIRWTETQVGVKVEKGLYSVLLGAVKPLPAATLGEMDIAFLGVSVGAVELTPRLRVGSNAYAAVAEVARHAATAGVADSAKAADGLSAACVNCVKASHIDASALAVNPANFADASIPLSKLASGSAGLDAATVKGKSPADATSSGTVNGGKLAVLDANGLVPASMLNVSSDALSLRGKIPADPSAAALANAGKLALFDETGRVPASALPSIPASLLPSIPASLLPPIPASLLPTIPASLLPSTLIVDVLQANTIKLGNSSIYLPFEGVQRPCPGQTAMQTFSASTATWSTCPTQWSCTTTPGHAGCVSASDYRSCKAIRADPTFNGTDGLYFVDPDGTAGSLPPLRAWCDMATEGGGWTLVVRITPSPSGWAHDDCGTVGTLTARDQAATAKWSDTAINALGAEVYKLSCRSLISYWDAQVRPFNACSESGSINRGKNGLNDAFVNGNANQYGRGLVANDGRIGADMYYGYTSANASTQGCYTGGVWGGEGWMMAR